MNSNQNTHMTAFVQNQKSFDPSNMSQTITKSIPVPNMDLFRTVTENQGKSEKRAAEKKRKRNPYNLTRLKKSIWVHLDQPNSSQHNFGVTAHAPTIRIGQMQGCNAFWLSPNGATTPTKSVNTYMGGASKDSVYVTQMNSYTGSATLLLLTRGNGINVALLKPKEEVFEGYSQKQLESVWPKKKQREKLEANEKKKLNELRMIADRLYRSNGGSGIPLLSSFSLATFQTIVADLRAKKPMVGASKTTINLGKIKSLVNNFEAAFGFWNPQPGSNGHMYKTQRDAVVIELAEYLRANDFARFMAAHALLTSDAALIKVEASNMASAKGSLPATSSTTTTNNSQLMYELKLDRLRGMVNAVATPLDCLDVSTPQKTLCQSMVKNSVYMKWVGAENVPTWEDLFAACADDTGLSNDNTKKILSQKSQDTWYGILCCLVLCYQSGIDCSAIAGEKQATKDGNTQSVYDRGGHLGAVKTYTQAPSAVKNARTMSINFKSVCRQGKRNDIVKAWERIFAELKIFADKDFWTAQNIKTTFDKLQINMEIGSSMRVEKKKWLSNKRNATLDKLKWVFILYMESLPLGTEVTLQNFLSTMVSPRGSCFCNAYIAWVGTAVYNLRMRIKENPANTPPWINKYAKKGFVVPTIENTLHGAPSKLLFRALETMINIEWPKKQSILRSAQDNALLLPESHGNTRLARAAGARMYWLIGAIRLNERFAPRDSIIDQIRTMPESFWKKIQPGDNHQKEFRTGLSLIHEPFGGIQLVLAQSKITGSDVDADTIKFNNKKHEVELYTPGGGFDSDYLSLESTIPRFLDAAEIVSGPGANRRYTIDVKDKDSRFIVMQATNVPTPATLHNSKYFANVPQQPGVPHAALFSKFESDYLEHRNKDLPPGKQRVKFVSNEKNRAHYAAIEASGVTMCYMPPKPTGADHTTSKGYSLETNGRIRDFFHGFAVDMNRNVPIAIGNPPSKDIKKGKWNLQTILSPTVGYVTGEDVTINSKYTFKSTNTLANLVNHGFSADEITSLRQLFRAIEVNELIVHPKWYGRQTQLAMKMGLLYCARKITGWIVDEPSTDNILSAAANAQAKVEGHEGNGKVEKKGSVPLNFYCKIFGLALGNPAKYFEHFDRRVRAHPTPAVFSLEGGIESFPSLITPCIEHDASESPLERALKDVRLLTTQEQMANLATLTVYKTLLQFIIDKQHDIPTHQQCVIRWFNERASYDASVLEKEVRQSDRKKQRKK